jgi:glutamine synthetase
MPLQEAVEESLLKPDRMRLRHLETLPSSLAEALDALTQDDVIMGALGAYISDRYVAAKTQEWDDYNRQVTPWELDRYLSRF